MRALRRPGLLALDDASVAGQEPFALQDDAELGIGLDERTGDPVPKRAGLSGRPAPVQSRSHVELALDAGDPERHGGNRPQHLTSEVLLERCGR